MSESFIRLPPDSTGKRIRTIARTINNQEVHESVVAIADPSSGVAIDPRNIVITSPISGNAVRAVVVDPVSGSTIDPRRNWILDSAGNIIDPRRELELDGRRLPTYSVAVAASAVAASKHHLVLFNGSGSGRIIEVLRVIISVENTAAVSGFIMGFRLIRTTDAGSGGTALTVNKMDTADPDLPSQIIVWTNPTTAPTLGPMVSVAAVNPEETGGTHQVELYSCTPYEKPLTLREGQGITVQQYATAGTGAFNAYVVFRVR